MPEPRFLREPPADDDVDPSTVPTASRTAGFAAPGLSSREAALADWGGRVADEPNATSVNDALGAARDRQLAEAAPRPARAAVTFGRAAGDEPSSS